MIVEHKDYTQKIKDISSSIGTGTLDTTAQTIIAAINELKEEIESMKNQ